MTNLRSPEDNGSIRHTQAVPREGEAFVPEREAQALREVGRTRIAAPTAVALALVFLLTIGLVPLIDWASRPRGEVRRPFGELVGGLGIVLRSAPEQGPVATNRAVKRDLDEFETEVEETSWLRRRFVSEVQWRLAVDLGLGNEQAYVGRDGWLFYRADVDHVIGRGFLEPGAQRQREIGGDLWAAAPQTDPVQAIELFVSQMKNLGIRTIVLPTPVKPTVHPEPLMSAAGESFRRARQPLQNASFAEFVARLEAAGIELFDPAALLVVANSDGGAEQYLRTDTHWTPQAVQKVAKELARKIEGKTTLLSTRTLYRRRPVVVQGYGDIAAMLGLPETQDRIPPQRVEVMMVLAADGTTWRARKSAEVLLIGDSFTNVYSDSSLGWGSSAGLAEQLSFELGRGVDKIAVNAGGAYAARAALRRALAEDKNRLEGTKVVVIQFATRELSQGDWRTITSPEQGQGLDQ